MKQISIQDLKEKLSASVAEAESGNTLVITRHNQPVARLIPAHPQNLHRGRELGRRAITPVLKRRRKIPYMDVLLDDRGDR